MATVTFDTLEATRRLRDAGFDEKQAEAVFRVLADRQTNLVSRDHFDGKFALIQWMLAFNLAFTMAILWKVLA